MNDRYLPAFFVFLVLVFLIFWLENSTTPALFFSLMAMYITM
jgi:hypothetical protein